MSLIPTPHQSLAIGLGGCGKGTVVCCCLLLSAGETNSMRLFPTPCSVRSRWWLEISQGGDIYTLEIDKCCTQGLSSLSHCPSTPLRGGLLSS